MSLDLKEHRGPTSLGTPEADGICIWAVPKCDTIAAMKRAVVEWSTVDSHISYKLLASKLPAGETADKIQDLIGKLVRAGALPCLDAGHGVGFRLLHAGGEDDKRALEGMAMSNLVECVLHAPAHSEWRLTRHAVDELSLAVIAGKPRWICHSRLLCL